MSVVEEVRKTTAKTPKSPYVPRLAEIVRAEEFTPREKFFELRLKDGQSLGHDAGQFVEVSIFGIGEMPLSISSSPTKEASFEVCVRSVGNVSNALRRLEPGSVVGIRGPFGRGFPVDLMRGKDVLIAAGGLGIVPLRSLINLIIDERSDFGRVIILYGARTPADFLFRDELAAWQARPDIELHTTVDIGDENWKGNVGVITTLFRNISIDPQNIVPVVVGPPVMFKFVVMELLARRIPESRVVVSLERRMKCGVGKCGHCQVGSVYVCQEGPVFTYAELKKVEEAMV